jgi:hypothetical protein
LLKKIKKKGEKKFSKSFGLVAFGTNFTLVMNENLISAFPFVDHWEAMDVEEYEYHVILVKALCFRVI